MRVTVKPKREDELLINGVIILAPDTGDLLRVEGHLAKSPSFWISRIEVVCTYDRIDGVRVPIHTESVAQVKMAGTSNFAMSYEYRTDQWPTRRCSLSGCPPHAIARNSISFPFHAPLRLPAPFGDRLAMPIHHS